MLSLKIWAKVLGLKLLHPDPSRCPHPSPTPKRWSCPTNLAVIPNHWNPKVRGKDFCSFLIHFQPKLGSTPQVAPNLTPPLGRSVLEVQVSFIMINKVSTTVWRWIRNSHGTETVLEVQVSFIMINKVSTKVWRWIQNSHGTQSILDVPMQGMPTTICYQFKKMLL